MRISAFALISPWLALTAMVAPAAAGGAAPRSAQSDLLVRVDGGSHGYSGHAGGRGGGGYGGGFNSGVAIGAAVGGLIGGMSNQPPAAAYNPYGQAPYANPYGPQPGYGYAPTGYPAPTPQAAPAPPAPPAFGHTVIYLDETSKRYDPSSGNSYYDRTIVGDSRLPPPANAAMPPPFYQYLPDPSR